MKRHCYFSAPCEHVRAVFCVALWLMAVLAAPCLVRSAEKALTENEKIETLIKNVEQLKDATFVRNGSDYDGKTAARFLRGKWQKQESEIKTAMDFINKAASVSSTSGKPYVI